ncbi:tRNA (adenosine(37)-N6)-threonylcarbamoyltransferase complex dimerization subunit type 1 TsaB [Maritimibacter fusiformis]|uniref:tRNA (Adenosine(37)-N6)-threonylcarbamoyltransferase complex dimerization subunit type 1 TsaB n=1 Tax=Maritimibacter fusiformis TaxID=2603819 RepID=A0A5D0RNT8_9RHOB|nr:tRNA (adenosine(37)-N6)-threonylcarbamoyltransferase complex dimerization subunit type 1 TsaB [Maritimibacter fusiformis]TYB82244.1 tRNA (adenosine(37)-N6)-threonylcarbamoyltransferase complex dimerization subunit type 1 TsaB [Maritimibacter fusiformis]
MPSDPTILAFDTSAAHCAAALLSGGRIVAATAEEMGRGQAERLMPMIEEMLAGAGFAWRDLDAVAVGIGPGNFTGIRISVAAARGLALGLGVPAIGVSTLEAQAEGMARPCLSLADARRGMTYALVLGEDGPPVMTDAPDALRPEMPRAPMADPATLAPAMARIAAARLALGAPLPRPAPLYFRSADAAPPKDPAPVILP